MAFRIGKKSDNLDRQKLAKVLAMTASEQDGEAIAAFRKAQKLLETAGVSLFDVAEEALDNRRFGIFSRKANPANQTDEQFRLELQKLQARLDVKSRELAEKDRQMNDLLHQVATLEKALERQHEEARGWRLRAWRSLWVGGEACV